MTSAIKEINDILAKHYGHDYEKMLKDLREIIAVIERFKEYEKNRGSGCPLKKLKIYTLYLKSHCEAPDFESTVEAENKEEAIKEFLKDPALREWDEDMIRDEILEE